MTPLEHWVRRFERVAPSELNVHERRLGVKIVVKVELSGGGFFVPLEDNAGRALIHGVVLDIAYDRGYWWLPLRNEVILYKATTVMAHKSHEDKPSPPQLLQVQLECLVLALETAKKVAGRCL